jgi:metal-sulfur cluster biosynthetic enzyme
MGRPAVPPPDPASVAAALERVHDPCSVASGAPLGLGAMARPSCEVDGDAVRVAIAVTGPGCTFAGLLLDRAADAVRAAPGVRTVDVRLDTGFVWDPDALAPDAADALTRRRTRTLALSAVRPRQWEGR